LLTSGLTLIMVVSLYALGGDIIHDFAFTLIMGIVTGTYSSVYVASPILLGWQTVGRKKKK
jgi:preprotein translocase subunit SecF